MFLPFSVLSQLHSTNSVVISFFFTLGDARVFNRDELYVELIY